MLGKKIVSALSIIFLVGCTERSSFETVRIYGHAGSGLENVSSPHHDNSRESVFYALSLDGCDGVEVDVQLDKNGQLWLFHDAELSPSTAGSGCINDQTSEELKSLTYKGFQGENVARLQDIDLTWLQGKDLFLDIRHYNTCQKKEIDKQLMLEALQQADFIQSSENVYCILIQSSWISSFVSAGFKVLMHVTSPAKAEELILSHPEIEGFVIKNADINSNQVYALRQSGKKVFLFEMRSPGGIRSAFEKYPDGLITDDIRATIIEKY